MFSSQLVCFPSDRFPVHLFVHFPIAFLFTFLHDIGVFDTNSTDTWENELGSSAVAMPFERSLGGRARRLVDSTHAMADKLTLDGTHEVGR